jgi:hypothetical protein
MYTWFYSTDADVLYWLCKTTLVSTWNYERTLINDKNPDYMSVMVCQKKGNLRFPTRMVKKFKTETLTSSAVVTSQTLHYLPDSQSLNLYYVKCLVVGHHRTEHCQHVAFWNQYLKLATCSPHFKPAHTGLWDLLN